MRQQTGGPRARFAGMLHARVVTTPFFEHDSHHHRYSGIGLMTPAKLHCADAPRITAERAVTLQFAFDRRPNRLKGRTPSHRVCPTKVYINPLRPKNTVADPSFSAETH